MSRAIDKRLAKLETKQAHRADPTRGDRDRGRLLDRLSVIAARLSGLSSPSPAATLARWHAFRAAKNGAIQ